MQPAHETLTFPINGQKLAFQVQLRERIADRQTEFQRIEVLQTAIFGRILLLDGHIQLTEFDEHAYHECLVQIPMLGLDAPRRVLVVGGGDGGAIREVARHASVERIDMVEIDAGVIEVCREHLPSLSAGAFDDPRVHLTLGDAFAFVKEAEPGYDLIIVDATDTYEDEEENLSENLFTREFYADCQNLLSDGGVVVSQADNHVLCPRATKAAWQALTEVFPLTGLYQGLVPSFGGFSGFVWGSKGRPLGQQWTPSAVEPLGLVYLNEVTYRLAFGLLRFA